jgi:hypothetical protein
MNRSMAPAKQCTGRMRRTRRRHAVLALGLFAVVAWAAPAHAGHPKTFLRPEEGCPPDGKPTRPEDANVAGHVPPRNDYLMERYHWDDGNGNDLTVEVWCVDQPPPSAYFTQRVIQSKNGVETVVVAPGGAGGAAAPGACCPYDAGRNVGPAFENPTTAEGDDGTPPRLITWISKNPHRPGEGLPDEDYQKTLIWSVPPKAIVGKIVVGSDGSIGYAGMFWTPRSPDGKPAKDLDDVERANLLALLRDEVRKADAFASEVASLGFEKPGAGNVVSTALATNLTVRMPEVVAAGREAVFSAAATRSWGAPLKTALFEWRFSDGRTFLGARVRPVFEEPGRYDVEVTVTDQFGARATATRSFTVSARAKR